MVLACFCDAVYWPIPGRSHGCGGDHLHAQFVGLACEGLELPFALFRFFGLRALAAISLALVDEPMGQLRQLARRRPDGGADAESESSPQSAQEVAQHALAVEQSPGRQGNEADPRTKLTKGLESSRGSTVTTLRQPQKGIGERASKGNVNLCPVND